ncbi:hypothetical protein Salat_0572300 [Sesamum alatum]|uniref:Uncharacterized protein n=1 Tax=Sesamum alatum TaxID=300844 RepID=A0AAE1YPP3_9LAMI|nr:hypothetical protein Salat_0572300 [Sesamum alatum]
MDCDEASANGNSQKPKHRAGSFMDELGVDETKSEILMQAKLRAPQAHISRLGLEPELEPESSSSKVDSFRLFNNRSLFELEHNTTTNKITEKNRTNIIKSLPASELNDN